MAVNMLATMKSRSNNLSLSLSLLLSFFSFVDMSRNMSLFIQKPSVSTVVVASFDEDILMYMLRVRT